MFISLLKMFILYFIESSIIPIVGNFLILNLLTNGSLKLISINFNFLLNLFDKDLYNNPVFFHFVNKIIIFLPKFSLINY